MRRPDLTLSSLSHVYGPGELATMAGVLDDAFQSVLKQEPRFDSIVQQQLRTSLARNILVAFGNGERDPQLLRQKALSGLGWLARVNAF